MDFEKTEIKAQLIAEEALAEVVKAFKTAVQKAYYKGRLDEVKEMLEEEKGSKNE